MMDVKEAIHGRPGLPGLLTQGADEWLLSCRVQEEKMPRGKFRPARECGARHCA
jgi:hypothetical protein